MRNQINRWNDERATTAVEFALVSPVFIVLVIGILYMCIGLFTVGSLHYAVEEGARCASIKSSTVCTDQPTTLAYINTHYFGPGTSPNFTVNYTGLPCDDTNSAGALGRPVSGSLNFVMNLGLTQISVPITANACYPLAN